MISNPGSSIRRADLDAVLAFLPIFEKATSKDIHESVRTRTTDDGVRELDMDAHYRPAVLSFQKTLCDHGFVQSFDWGQWQGEAERLVARPELLREADMDTCIKLLTLHVRKERFSAGHLGAMIESGHITAILRRLSGLRDGLPG